MPDSQGVTHCPPPTGQGRLDCGVVTVSGAQVQTVWKEVGSLGADTRGQRARAGTGRHGVAEKLPRKRFSACAVFRSPSHVQLCDPMHCNMPGFPVLHHLPDFTQRAAI